MYDFITSFIWKIESVVTQKLAVEWETKAKHKKIPENLSIRPFDRLALRYARSKAICFIVVTIDMQTKSSNKISAYFGPRLIFRLMLN